jgi:hypothetical protein
MVSRMALSPMFGMPMPTIVSNRASASRVLLAWTVASDPSWPVFMAVSMSMASPPRISPRMMRSGRIRRQFLTRSRCVISPLPSRFEGRVSRRTTWFCWSCSSAESSIVMIRSWSGMNDEHTLSSVVFPEPVPPEMMVFRRERTHPRSTSRIGRGHDPSATRSSA